MKSNIFSNARISYLTILIAIKGAKIEFRIKTKIYAIFPAFQFFTKSILPPMGSTEPTRQFFSSFIMEASENHLVRNKLADEYLSVQLRFSRSELIFKITKDPFMVFLGSKFYLFAFRACRLRKAFLEPLPFASVELGWPRRFLPTLTRNPQSK